MKEWRQRDVFCIHAIHGNVGNGAGCKFSGRCMTEVWFFSGFVSRSMRDFSAYVVMMSEWVRYCVLVYGVSCNIIQLLLLILERVFLCRFEQYFREYEILVREGFGVFAG